MITLSGSIEIKRIYEFLEKALTEESLANYNIPIDSEGDSATLRVPLDKLRTALIGPFGIGYQLKTEKDQANGYAGLDVNGRIANTEIRNYQLYQPDQSNPFVYTDNSGALHIDGDIIQNGSTYETHAEQIYTKKDLIITREDAVAGLGIGEYTGFQANLYDGANNGQLVFDKDGWARVGDVGSLLKLATIEETPTNNLFSYWDSASSTLKTRAIAISDVTNLTTTLAGKLTGIGTINFIPKFTASGTIGISRMSDDGTDMSITSGKLKISSEMAIAYSADSWSLAGAKVPTSGTLLSIFIGANAGNTSASGVRNIFVGVQSGAVIGNGGYNSILGNYSATVLATGFYNAGLGDEVFKILAGGSGNTSIGYLSGRSIVNTHYNIFLGNEAGYYETGHASLYISSLTSAEQVNESTAKTKALIYGLNSTTTANQLLRVNGSLQVLNGNVGIGGTPTQKFELFGSLANIQMPSNGVVLNFTRSDASYITAGTSGGYLIFTTNGIGPETIGANLIMKTAGVNNMPSLPVYSSNPDALAGGLVAGDLYKSSATSTAQVLIVNAT